VAGTSLFLDLTPGTNSSYPVTMGFFNGKQLFQASSPEAGNELWLTDGTVTGTQLLLDINPGPADSSPTSRFYLDGRMYFLADDGVHGRELWTTNGTAGGTFLVADIAAGPQSSNVMNMTNVGGQLWFTANDGINGVSWYKAGPPKIAMQTQYYLSDHWQVPLAPAVSATVPGTPLTWEWDLDGDGVFAESGAGALGGDETKRDDAVFSSDLFTSGQRTIALRVRDADGFSRTVSSTVRINDISGLATAPGGHYTMTGPAGGQVLSIGGSGGVTFNADLGATRPNLALVVEAAGSATFNSTQRLGRISLQSGGRITVAPGGDKVVVTTVIETAGGAYDRPAR